MIKPLGERILIKPGSGEEKTKGGIFIPDSAKDKTNTGIVIAVGEKVTTIKPTQKIIFDEYAGSQISYNNEKHIILELKDVLAIEE